MKKPPNGVSRGISNQPVPLSRVASGIIITAGNLTWGSFYKPSPYSGGTVLDLHQLPPELHRLAQHRYCHILLSVFYQTPDLVSKAFFLARVVILLKGLAG